MVALAVWLALLPFRIAYRLGFRGTVALICVLVLTVSVYGIAEDLGLLETPAIAAPCKPGRRPVRQPPASSTATADIPRGYLALYRQAGARYRVPWSTLAGIGKVESDHGRSRLPGVRSDANFAGACGPMQIGCVSGSKGREQLGALRPRRSARPGQRDPGRGPLPGRPRRPPQPRPGHLRLQPLPRLRRAREAVGGAVPRRWPPVTVCRGPPALGTSSSPTLGKEL